MIDPMVRVGARFQKASKSRKVYRVIGSVSRSYHPPHVQLSVENNPTEVITVSSDSLFDSKFWLPLD